MPAIGIHARRRIAALAVLAVVVATIVWLAGGGPGASEGEPERRAAETVERFVEAASEGDFASVCGLLAPEARRVLRAAANELSREDVSCAELLERSAGEELSERSVRVEYVNVAGPRARVEAVLFDKRARSATRDPRTFMLVEDEGGERWLISALGG